MNGGLVLRSMGSARLTAEVWAVIITGAVVLLLILPALLVALLVLESFVSEGSHDRSVAQVQRFIDLTEQARAVLRASPQLPLFEDDAATATSEAISRMRAVKDETRKQLWS